MIFVEEMEYDGVSRPVTSDQSVSETSHLLDLHTGPNYHSDEVANHKNITVEEAIETIGFGKFQLGILTYTGLAWLADAAEMILLSFIGPSVNGLLV